MSAKSYSDALPFIQSIDALTKAIDDATSVILVSRAKGFRKRMPAVLPSAADVLKVVPFAKGKKSGGCDKYGDVRLVATGRGKCVVKVTPSAKAEVVTLVKEMGIKDAKGRLVKLGKSTKAQLAKGRPRKLECRIAACPPPKW